MKIKSLPEDFVVDEVSKIKLGHGKFSIYRLSKTNIGTLEALTHLASDWNIPKSRFSYCGLKDRHARTTQLVGLEDGPEQNGNGRNWSAEYLGKAKSELSAKNLQANKFTIVIRDLDVEQAESLCQFSDSKPCIPNYFDKQRFGSVTHDGQFPAVPWCQGNYERAVFLALAEHNPHDRPVEQKQRAILRDNWGDWLKCKELLDRSNRRSVVTYLVDHPEGFKKAAGLIDRSMRSLYVSAFQSRLWNEVVSQLLANSFPDSAEVDEQLTCGKLVYPPGETARNTFELETIPLPSGRPTRWPAKVQRVLASILQRYDLEVHKLRFSYPRDVFFSRQSRSVWIDYRPISSEQSTDELEENRYKVRLEFSLSPGQYATMVLKALEAKLGVSATE